MKFTLERFEPKGKGFVAVMRSDGVRADMQARADRVAARVRSEAPPYVHIQADTTSGKTRAGGTVAGVPMRIEKARRLLGRAMDAAR